MSTVDVDAETKGDFSYKPARPTPNMFFVLSSKLQFAACNVRFHERGCNYELQPEWPDAVGNHSYKYDVLKDTSDCLEWSMVLDRAVRFGEGAFVIGTCKKPASTLMMSWSCGTWNESAPVCVLSMRVVGFFEWVRVKGAVLYL